MGAEKEREKERERERERQRDKDLADAEERILAGGTVKRGLSILQEHGHRYQRSHVGLVEGARSPVSPR